MTAEQAAEAARRTMATGVWKGRSMTKEATMENTSAKGWVASKEALAILNMSSPGALANKVRDGKVVARQPKGKGTAWEYNVDSLHAHNKDRGKGRSKGRASSKVTTTYVAPAKGNAQESKGSQDDRVAQLEKELATLREQLAPKPRFARIRRKIAAFRAA